MKPTSPHDLNLPEWCAVHLRELIGAGLAVVVLMIALRSFEWPGASLISGRVTSQGKAVTFGTVTVLDAHDRIHTVAIAPDGSYVLRGVPPGPVRVAVASPNPRSVVERAADATEPRPATQADPPPSARRSPAGRSPGGVSSNGAGPTGGADAPQGTAIAAPGQAAVPPPPTGSAGTGAAGWFPIPGRYANPLHSGIRAAVGRGRTALDLNLD
jgi:hypothetical protein